MALALPACCLPAPPQIVASIVQEWLVGVDSAIKVVVPPGVELQGSARPPAAPGEAAGSGQEQQREQPAGCLYGAEAHAPQADCGSGGADGGLGKGPAAEGAAASGPPADGRSGTAGARQLMQRKLDAAGPAAAQQEQQQRQQAALAPAASKRSAALAAANPAPDPPAAGGPGRWTGFVPAPAATKAPQPALKQSTLQQSLQRGAAATRAQTPLPGAGQQQRQGQQQAAQPSAKPGAAATLQAAPSRLPTSLAAGPPGALFQQFALGSSMPPPAPKTAGPAWQPRGLSSSMQQEQPSHAAVPEEAAGAKRPRLEAVPAPAASAAPAAAAPGALGSLPAAPPAKRTLSHLPKLGFLRASHLTKPAPAAAAQPAAPVAPAAGVPAAAQGQAATPAAAVAAQPGAPALGSLFSCFL